MDILLLILSHFIKHSNHKWLEIFRKSEGLQNTFEFIQ